MLHIGNLFPGEGKGWSDDLPTEEGARKGQHSASQCRPKLQPNYRRNFSKDSNLYRQMDQVNRRSRDFRYCIGLSTGFFRDSSSAKTANSIQPFRRGGEVGGFGGAETSEEEGYRGGRTLRKSVSVKHFHDTQEGWREKAGGRHEGLEQFHRTSSFQNGGSVTLAITPPEGGFYVQDRLERCISNNSNCKKIKDLPKVSLERETLPVHMSTFRPQILSKNFHKGSEASLSLPQSSGSSTAGVFRRHTYHGSNPRAMSGAYAADMAVVDRFRFSGKPKEVSFSTQKTSRIPGVHCKFHRNEIVFNGRKTVKSKTRSREAAEIKPSGKDIGKLLGLLPVNSSSHCSGSSPFQKFTGRCDKGLKRLKGGTRLPECSLSLSGGQERTGMVEGLRKNEQWQKHFAPGRTRHNILRCFQARMGGTSESSKNRGSMELGGKVKITHKLARVKSSFPGFASFSSPTKTSACSDWHRQQNSNDLYQQIRGNPFTSSHISSLRDVELCSRQKPDFVSSVCSRRGKPDCRQKVKGVPGQPGMDAASSGVSGITKRGWLFQYRSLCNTGEPSGSCICQLETRAWGSCHRCFQCKMGFSTGLPIPSLLYDQKVPQKNSARSGTLCPDHTSVEKQPLVSSHSSSVSRATIASAKTAGSSETSRHRKDTPPVPSKKLQAGCMAHFRAKLAKEGFSQKVSDILLSSWRKKTASQYESAWKAWSGWCSEREINPFSTTLENIFEFLADLFHKGFKFRTLGVYRSAISSNYETVDGFVIGKHPMMAKFMKGVFSLRPLEPKYFVTWDVRQVLDFLKTWSPAESLSLKQLTLKLVMLAALITAARSSSVNKMNLCFRYFKPHGVLFKVPGLTKCAGPKRPLQNLFLASFPPDRRLCFVNYPKQYEKVTKNLRQKTENTQNLLFISYVKPHKPVTLATIA